MSVICVYVFYVFGGFQGAFHELRPKDLRCGVSFLVGVAAWILPKLYSLVYWRNKM